MAYWHRIINHEFTDDQNEELKDLWKCQIRPVFRNFSKIIIMAVPLVAFLFLIIWFVDKSDLILGYIDSLFERAFVEAGTKAFPFYFNPRDYLVRLFQSWPLAGILSLYLAAYFFVLGSNWKRIWSDNFLQNIWMISWKTILLLPFWKLLLRFFMFLFESIRGPSTYFKRLHKEFSTKSLLLSIFPKINLSILFPTLILTVSLVNFAAIFSLFIGYFTMVEPFCFLYPSLKVKEKTLVAQEPNPAIIRYYLEKGKDKESDWLSFTRGIDLRGRDLRFADFTKSKLFKADLRSAKLQGANLKKTQLQEANLQGAQLQGTDLVDSQLQGSNLQNARLKWANLGFARLRYSDLRNAHLERANLIIAQLQGANLKEAQLQGANLVAANLQETNLSLAQLQGAFLTMATLQGAVLWKAQLQGANLYRSELQGVDLNDAQLQGADLQYAKLQGAILWNASLQGSDLKNALLQGAALGHAQLQGADLAHAEFQGAVLWKAQLQGANLVDAQFEGIWGGIDLNKSVRWEALLEEVLPKLPKLKRREFINSIKEAEKRTQDFDTPTAVERFKTQITLKQFLENRNRLVCQDEYIAKGILHQYDRFSDVQFSEVINPDITEEMRKQDLREYIEQNCPEVAEKIEW